MKHFQKTLNLIFALVLLLMLITATCLEENSTYSRYVFDEDLSDGWMLSEPNGTRSEVTFPYDFAEGKNTIQIVRTLPQVPDYAVLQLMCNYQAMTAYVDGVEIFHALPSTFGLVKTDMGHYVALIPLSSEYSGKEIVIQIVERTSGVRSEIGYIRLTSAAQYGFHILEEDALHLIISLLMLIGAIAALVTWLLLWSKNGAIPEESYHPLLWICLFASSVGVWFFTEAYIWAISTGSFAVSGTLNYLALSLMPVSLLGILKSICSQKLSSLRWIVLIAKSILIVEWFLFLTGLVDFSEMLIFMQAECIIAAVIFAVFLVWKRELFLVGNVIRYGTWALLGVLVITIVSYFRGGNWLLWALFAALVILASVMLSTFIKLNWTIKDVAQTKQYKEYALTDIMTSLKSRYAYTIFEAHQKVGSLPNSLQLIFMDIDMLKKTNDTLGHVAGDEMIVATSKCIKDAFGDIAECFRMGGDEFLVAMTAEPNIVQERIDLFNELISQWHGRYVDHLTVSYGVVGAKEYPHLSFEELLKMADDMMYQHKQQRIKCR